MSQTTIEDLPPELIEQIVLELDPIYVASFAQTCSAFRSFVYDTPDQHLWRLLYLAQPRDDPRTCVDTLGNPLPEPDWRDRLQRITRAHTIVQDWTQHRPGELTEVLHTLLELVCNLPPAASVFINSAQLSLNLVWTAALLRGGDFLDAIAPLLPPADAQLHAQLHTRFGLTITDYGRARALHHVMSMHVVPPHFPEENAPYAFTIFPMSLPYCQSVLPPGMDLDVERDWAGVAGLWQCSFCFCDHRELLLYNNFNTSDTEPLQTAIFDNPGFVEIFRSISIELRVIGTEPDPEHPTRPTIKFAGEVDHHATVVGWVKLTPDNHIRWHYKSGEHGNAIWSSEGVQIAGVRSTFGVLGSWTTVHHDRHDPVGPFWLRKVHPPLVNREGGNAV